MPLAPRLRPGVAPGAPGGSRPKAILDALSPEYVTYADTYGRVDKLERSIRGGMLKDARERAAAHYWLVDLALRCGVLVGRVQSCVCGDRKETHMINDLFERVRVIEAQIADAG